jgi:hypothetical protein
MEGVIVVRSLLAALLLVTMVCGGLAPGVVAQDASPAASPATAGAPLDLAAMALFPADIDAPNFGAGSSRFEDAAVTAADIATLAGLPEADVLAALQGFGYGRRYRLNLEQPFAEGVATPVGAPNPIARRIGTTVTEYATADGAAAGFDYLERETEALDVVHPEAQDLPVTTIGDETDLTHYSAIATDTNLPYQELNLTFRVGNLVGDVYYQDFTSQMPDTAEVEALAETLKARFEQVVAEGAPGLSSQSIRAEAATDYDGYLVLDGNVIPAVGESAEAITALRESLGEATAVYTVQQPLGEAPYLAVWLYQFPSADSAAAWLAGDPTAPMAVSDANYVDVVEAPDAATIGEESRVYSYGYSLDAETTSLGFAIFTRVGDTVARVQIDSLPDVPQSVVQELAAVQAMCLESGECLYPVVNPAPLLAPVATPAA